MVPLHLVKVNYGSSSLRLLKVNMAPHSLHVITVNYGSSFFAFGKGN